MDYNSQAIASRRQRTQLRDDEDGPSFFDTVGNYIKKTADIANAVDETVDVIRGEDTSDELPPASGWTSADAPAAGSSSGETNYLPWILVGGAAALLFIMMK